MAHVGQHLLGRICRGGALVVLLGLGILRLQADLPAAGAAGAPEEKLPNKTNTGISNAPEASPRVMLPFVSGSAQPPSVPLLIGVATPGQYFGTQGVVDSYLKGLDSWVGLSKPGKGHSIAEDFEDLNPFPPNQANHTDSYVAGPLTLFWNNGYTDFLNLGSTASSAAIANGCCDAGITAWARSIATWINRGGGHKLYIAPLQEMNGNWTSYGMDPANFKLAYQHIQALFASVGVTRGKVWWVFAPNGWSTPPYHIVDYYPGDDKVDIIGFSSYNQSCRAAWMNPTEVFDPYLQEIRTTVSTSKPIFVAQTATSSAKGNKDQWIRDAYSYFLAQGIRGVLYYNADLECDWAVYQPPNAGGRQVQGYKDAVTAPNATRYIAPATLSGMTLPP